MSISTILPLLSAIFVFYMGAFILFKNRGSKLNILFALLCLSIIFWFFGTFMMFTSDNVIWAEFWDRFVYVGVIFIPTFMYHISLVFSKKKEGPLVFLGYFLSLAFLILSRTDYFVSDVYQYSWGYHTQARFFHHIFLVFFSVYLLLFYFNIYKYYKTAKTAIERLQAKYIFAAFLVLVTGSIAYLPAYGIDVFPSSYISGLIFAIVLGYTIIKYQLMNLKVVLTEFLVGLIALILFVEAASQGILYGQLYRWALFLIFLSLGYLLIKSVLNEIKRREELKRAYEDLEKLDKAKSEFLSIVSHQLRTPLTAIKGYISMMLEGTYGRAPQKMEKPLKNIHASNERLIKLINDLLNVSRIESGKIRLKSTKVSLEKVISSIIEELKVTVKDKGLYLKLEKPQDPIPQIILDQEKIRQVIINIIDNAIKYTQKGGITVKLAAISSEIQIIIQDTGEGMDKDEMANIFKSFARGSAGPKLNTEGVGIGLYIAKKFVDLHKGNIWVESEGKGKGSTFFIELPLN